MLEKLSDHPQKVPVSDQNYIMKMLNKSVETVTFDNNKAYKTCKCTG